jgi:hypothetical protein
MAQHVHEHWARTRLNDGWSWGPETNDEMKTHSLLIPHGSVPLRERRDLLDAILHILKILVTKMGISIDSSQVDPTKLQWQFARSPDPSPTGPKSRQKPMHASSFTAGVQRRRLRRRPLSSPHDSDDPIPVARLSSKSRTLNANVLSNDKEYGDVDISTLAQDIYDNHIVKIGSKAGSSLIGKSSSVTSVQLGKTDVDINSKTYTYTPRPLPLENVDLPPDIFPSEDLIEPLVKSMHDIRSFRQMERGWTFGPTFDVRRQTSNTLVPYRHLHEKERNEVRAKVEQVLKGMVWLGYIFTANHLPESQRHFITDDDTEFDDEIQSDEETVDSTVSVLRSPVMRHDSHLELGSSELKPTVVKECNIEEQPSLKELLQAVKTLMVDVAEIKENNKKLEQLFDKRNVIDTSDDDSTNRFEDALNGIDTNILESTSK